MWCLGRDTQLCGRPGIFGERFSQLSEDVFSPQNHQVAEVRVRNIVSGRTHGQVVNDDDKLHQTPVHDTTKAAPTPVSHVLDLKGLGLEAETLSELLEHLPKDRAMPPPPVHQKDTPAPVGAPSAVYSGLPPVPLTKVKDACSVELELERCSCAPSPGHHETRPLRQLAQRPRRSLPDARRLSSYCKTRTCYHHRSCESLDTT